MIWIEFAVSALVTAATYGAGPMLLALLRKKPLRVRYLRIFSAVYTIAVWAVWQFLTYDGNAVRTMPALLWGYVFYRLARSVLEKKPVPAIPKERWYTCPKCGQLVPEGKPCDCESLSPQPGKKLCGTPFIQAGKTPPGVETEQPKPGKRPPVVPLCIAAALLVVCTCILGYRVSVLTAARDDLTAENKQLQAEISSLRNASAPSFSSWSEWKKLSDAGCIDISYDEWLTFMGERENGVASSFLREKAEAQREEADREYGPTAYGSTCWRLWSDLSDAGYTGSTFEDFAEAYSAQTGGGLTLTQESTGKTWHSK